ncbi:unnamed protein product [Ceratitis capitata]|uniref:(Mediterranean fruit fly) hypothetical protein n=1 Tax=Ceratitis capitata TaxID=7213 RepID=A0A811UGB8_CERCA|nr:unnamed protein product [Ceratitis capitata]
MQHAYPNRSQNPTTIRFNARQSRLNELNIYADNESGQTEGWLTERVVRRCIVCAAVETKERRMTGAKLASPAQRISPNAETSLLAICLLLTIRMQLGLSTHAIVAKQKWPSKQQLECTTDPGRQEQSVCEHVGTTHRHDALGSPVAAVESTN